MESNDSNGIAINKVAIIDDNKYALRILKMYGNDAGFRCETFNSGAMCLEYLHAHMDIHLFLIDLYMPVMNGIELATCIKAFNNNNITLIAMVPEYDEEMTKELFDDTLLKPTTKSIILKLLNMYI